MAKKDTSDDALRCSFCNKSQREVKKLIAGPNVFICDECVDICLDIIAEDRMLEQQAETSLPRPQESKALLDEYVGRYELRPDFVLAVTREGGRLFTQATGQRPIEVFAEAKDRLFARAVDAQLVIRRDA